MVKLKNVTAPQGAPTSIAKGPCSVVIQNLPGSAAFWIGDSSVTANSAFRGDTGPLNGAILHLDSGDELFAVPDTGAAPLPALVALMFFGK